MIKAISLSGGLDSAVLLAHVLNDTEKEDVCLFNFMYPSKHNVLERGRAAKLADYYGLALTTIDVTNIFKESSSSLIGKKTIPEGAYDAISMSSTVVHMRNGIFVAIVASRVAEAGGGVVLLGAHSGDHAIYADCTPAFLKGVNDLVQVSTSNTVSVEAPFMSRTKDDIVGYGHALGVPFNLTRTCYTEKELACGKCGSCNERLEAFENNGLKDPIRYKEAE